MDASADRTNQLPKMVMETTGFVTNNLAEDHLPVNLFWNQKIFWDDGVRQRTEDDHGLRKYRTVFRNPEVA